MENEPDTSFKAEQEKKPTICGICGDLHPPSACSLIPIKHYIKDSPMLSKARLSLPNTLKIEAMSEGSHSVIALVDIDKGTKFGPFEAKKLFTLDPSITFPLKIFQGEDYFQEYYLDTTNEYECNWLYFVQSAESEREQNLVCFEDACAIYYTSSKDILAGEHLKVWYSPYYCMKMNKSLLTCAVEVVDENNSCDFDELLKKQQKIKDRKSWSCKFCGKEETSVLRFAQHIKEHYMIQLQKICEVCKKGFQTRQSLKKHILFNHYNCEKYAQNIHLDKPEPKPMPKQEIGGPLLNAEPLDTHLFEMEPPTIMLDSDNLNMSVDNILSDMENFNFNIEEADDKFVCDICSKGFGKLKLLLRHLTSHTGRFKCDLCLKVFSRKENLDAHKCCTGNMIKCDKCEQTFCLKKYLNRHIALKHNSEFVCAKDCKKTFPSSKTLHQHKCQTEPMQMNCNVCQKEFFNRRNLRRHMKTHMKKPEGPHLCEVCSKQFATYKLFQQHMTTHNEKKFTCEVCDKKFFRKTYLDLHLKLHTNELNFPCNQCEQKFPLKKYLTSHLTKHENIQKYSCLECNLSFKQKSNMQTHYNRMHNRKCPNCDETFDSPDKLRQHRIIHYEKCYECPICKYIFKLRSSFIRHFKRKHPEKEFDLQNVRRIERTIESNAAKPTKETTMNSEDIVNLLNMKEKVDPEAMQDIDSNLDYIVNNCDNGKIIDDNILDFNSIEMEFEKNYQANNVSTNQEVCLSMPELSDVDQKITLGENAYILDNGTIIEPIEQGKVLLYILENNKT